MQWLQASLSGGVGIAAPLGRSRPADEDLGDSWSSLLSIFSCGRPGTCAKVGKWPWAHCLCRRPTALANQPRRKSTKLQQSDMGGMPLMMECVSPADTYQHPEDMRLRHRNWCMNTCHSSLSHLDPLVSDSLENRGIRTTETPAEHIVAKLS